MSIFYYNSKFLKQKNIKISPSNRAYNYGDGFFESIRIINSKTFNFKAHYNRYTIACNILKIDDKKSIKYFDRILKKLINKNNIINGYAKIHVSRGGSGKYLPNSNNSDIIVTIKSSDKFKFNNAISLCFFSNELKSTSTLSNIKSLNTLIPILASIYAKDQNADNALLQNTKKNIIEATNSNLFIIKNNLVYTPPKEDGPVLGTMRSWVIKQVKVKEKSLNKKDILTADEIFLTNSIKGIIPVSRIINNNRKYVFNFSNKLQSKLINLSLDL